MKARSVRLIVALAATMTMVGVQPALAQAQPPTTPPEPAANVVAEVGAGADTLYGLAPQTADPNNASTTGTYQFDLPDACMIQDGSKSLRCGGQDAAVEISAVNVNGVRVKTSVAFQEGRMIVRIPSEAAQQSKVVVAPFIGADHNQSQLEDAADAMEAMVVNEDSSMGTVGTMAAISRPSKITVPSNYIYNPKATKNRSLHDYCTWSPNSFAQAVKSTGRTYVTLRADFKGPLCTS
ncbi:hypothetical protein [Arthrobacter rhombi]|uniref:hypothetical protein n=1 Tax=Arthrobacter rhombi TaxID=71253 RepID=UPI0031D05250